MEAGKLGFCVITGKYDNDSDRRQTFVTMRCESSGMYQSMIRKLKHDGTRSRKCEYPFKLCRYRKANDTWKFNVVSGMHDYALSDKLAGHPIVCRLIPEENELVSDMTLNTVASKSILANLKRKRP
ncbi:uncharacterized protein LOC127102138 [Lathyrus oleraceus]|uniref:uncharacterized protein LOC127102138 n=1 Tax=Pisum sativum TaxID=3888 RepID=UPI0021D0B0D1|nr:uncharacterized protein LOC127102138 [Pisum sativum]